MTSTTAKVALLSYCRFARQYHYVATEVSIAEGLADVLASDGNNLIEYEIKISLQDLIKDQEKSKHLFYDPTAITWEGSVGIKGKTKIELVQGRRKYDPEKWTAIVKDENDELNLFGWDMCNTEEEARVKVEGIYGSSRKAPNTLYYVIPTLLWDKYQERILSHLHDSYGVLTFSSKNYHSLEVKKKAKKLHKNPVSQDVLSTIVARMSSELAGLTNAYYNHVEDMASYGKMIEKKFELDDVED
jgi:hypothetical protein